LGQEDHFVARTIRGIAYVEDVEPVAAKVTLELVAFAKAQGRGRSHDLLADSGRTTSLGAIVPAALTIVDSLGPSLKPAAADTGQKIVG
jgi:hypothetical protein